ncbi:MAG: hypothetical protein KC492_22075 [Myxococcales bacterium]|nr:hypothetical protein [Myxococcales bacterium]MCB9607926.1 hypothetical protein [Polyangiaceae bacterium]
MPKQGYASDRVLTVPYAPRPPFVAWPEQWSIRDGYTWLTPHGSAIVTQLNAEFVEPEMVHSLHDILDELLERDIHKHFPKLCVLHDWRAIRKLPKEARQAWTERTRRPGMPLKHLDAFIAVGSGPLARMALQTAALTIQLAVGQTPARIVDDPQEVLDRLAITPPSAEFFRRWQVSPEAAAEGATRRDWQRRDLNR